MNGRRTSTKSARARKCLGEYEDGCQTNRRGVPYHAYTITLENGEVLTMNVGYEDDWGNVQECAPDDTEHWEEAVGWGNDVDGHIKIVAVVDEETGKSLNVRQWAKNNVWNYVNCYSEGGCEACLALERARPRRLNGCPWLLSLLTEKSGRPPESAVVS